MTAVIRTSEVLSVVKTSSVISGLRFRSVCRFERHYGVLQTSDSCSIFSAFLCAPRAFFRSRLDTSLEDLALRQQIAVLKRQRPRPPLTRFDRFFWITLKAGLAAMVRRSGHREARNRDRMASSGFPSVLALAIAATGWAAED